MYSQEIENQTEWGNFYHSCEERFIEYWLAYVVEHKQDHLLFDADLDNINQFLQTAQTAQLKEPYIQSVLALDSFWRIRGLYLAAEPYLSQACNWAIHPSDDLWHLQANLGLIKRLLYQYDASLVLLKANWDWASRERDVRKIIQSLASLGNLEIEFSHYSEAEKYLQKAKRQLKYSNDFLSEGSILNGLAAIKNYFGDYTVAEKYWLRSVQSFLQSEEPHHVSISLANLGSMYIRQGKYLEAYKCLQNGLKNAQELGYSLGIIRVQTNLGVLENQRGNPLLAQLYFQEALALARITGERRDLIVLLINLSSVMNDCKQYLQAKIHLEEAQVLAQNDHDDRRLAFIFLNLGCVLRREGDFSRSYQVLIKGLEIAQETKHLSCVIFTQTELGDLALSQHAFKAAHTAFREAYHQAKKVALREAHILGAYGLGRVCAAQGEWAKAAEFGQEALRLAEETKYKQLAEIREWMAGLAEHVNGEPAKRSETDE